MSARRLGDVNETKHNQNTQWGQWGTGAIGKAHYVGLDEKARIGRTRDRNKQTPPPNTPQKETTATEAVARGEGWWWWGGGDGDTMLASIKKTK